LDKSPFYEEINSHVYENLSMNYVVAGEYIGRKYIRHSNIFQAKREGEDLPVLNTLSTKP
jgi:hypothetical protein